MKYVLGGGSVVVFVGGRSLCVVVWDVEGSVEVIDDVVDAVVGNEFLRRAWWEEKKRCHSEKGGHDGKETG